MNIYIQRRTLQKIKYYVKHSDVEIAGLARITELGDNNFIIHDAEIIDQCVSLVHADFDERSMAKFLERKIRAGESPASFKVWWHSHGHMNAYFSSRDVETINNSTEFPYLVSIVFNKKHEYACRVDIFDPMRMTLENVSLVETEDEDPVLEKQCLQDIKKHITNYAKKSTSKGKKKYLTPQPIQKK